MAVPYPRDFLDGKVFTMEKFGANLCAYNALAIYMATLGLQKILGGIAVWSNMDVELDEFLNKDDVIQVGLYGNRIHVPGTRHLYKGAVQVKLVKTRDGHWQFREMTIFLHHRDIGNYSGTNPIDISLEPGIEPVTMFTTEQSEVDNPHLAYEHLLPAQTSHFAIPE
jgi:hypothetical protein